MANLKHTITDSEYKIMKVLWNADRRLTVSDVVKALDHNEWTPSTVATFFAKAAEKRRYIL